MSFRPMLSFAVFAAASLAVPVAWAATYQVQDLGTYGTATFTPVGIDRTGRVYGSYYNDDGYSRGYRTQVGGTLATSDDLGDLGGVATIVLAVSPLGQVVGSAYDATNTRVVAIRTTTSGTVTPSSGIDPTFAVESEARGVSSDGRVAGLFQRPGDETVRAFRTTSTGVIDDAADLGTLGGPTAIALGVSTLGTVVGYSDLADGTSHAFRHSSPTGKLTANDDLGTLGGDNSSAFAIALNFAVIGNSELANGNTHAFYLPINAKLTNTPTADLGTLGGSYSYANATNPLGTSIVGEAAIAGDVSHAFLWTAADGMIDLNTMIPADSGWTLEKATAINSSGVIAGMGLYQGEARAFLLSVPEPSTLALLGIAILPLARRRKTVA